MCVADGTGVNLAAGQPAYQPSNYWTTTTADKAVDSNTDGNFASLSCACVADDRSPNSWLVVDLGSQVYVFYVTLYNRIDCCRE